MQLFIRVFLSGINEVRSECTLDVAKDNKDEFEVERGKR